jgi:sodium/proline symporter
MTYETNIGAWGWIWVVVFLLLFIGMGAYGMRKTKTEEDFAVARGAYGPFMLAFAFAVPGDDPGDQADQACR